ncbi:M48 family metallopeptidase [Halapricum salinum]|uniref:Protease HtpX homolog n=1 Tax=Halapricum salinum TaxID=1457250 RepID=A0A4D6HC25_9EURY|nr:M48 family metalloprotease [Halapricum salinum]QCC51543.1 protease [Halapricum salinum]
MRHPGLKLRMAVVGSILFGFYALVAGLLYLTFGGTMTVLAAVLVGSVLLIGAQYKIGKWGALKSVGAQDMPEDDPRFREIHRTVEELSDEMGIDKPRLMIADMGVPNAFAVGRKGAGVVVVSSQLIQLLDKEELDGVIAHELAHIKNRDVVMMVIGQGIATIVGLVAQFAVMFAGDNDIADLFLGMIVGNIVQFLVMLFVLAISRYREYVADSDAAGAIGQGDPLARALEKISNTDHSRSKVSEEASALCIFGESKSFLSKIVSTHPPTEKRIEKLRSY